MASILGKWSLSSSIASLVDLFHRNRCKIIVDHFLSNGGGIILGRIIIRRNVVSSQSWLSLAERRR